jgi:putative membrane protein
MMYGYGIGWGWMMLMPVLWIVLLAVLVWATVRLVQRPGEKLSAQEILDRRYASGEIDADTYADVRSRLAGRQPGPR